MGRRGPVLSTRQGSALVAQPPATMPPRPPKKRYLMEYPARFGSTVTEVSGRARRRQRWVVRMRVIWWVMRMRPSGCR